MAEIYQLPDSNGNNSVPAWLPYVNNGNNGGLFGGNGWGGGILGFVLGLLFGNNGLFGNGLFGGGGGNNAGTAYLGNMISNDNGRELIMQAVTNQGEASRSAIQQLSTTIGQDFNLVNGAIQAVQGALNTVAANQGTNALQIINAIQSGNAAIASQFAQCCCENRLSMCQMGNTIGQGFAGVQQSIAAKSAADQLMNCQTKYDLTDSMNRNFLALDNKIDAMESSRKDREITALTAQVAKLESEKYTAAVAQQSVAPVIGQLNALSQEVAAIKRCQPPVRTVVDNGYTAVPTLWANGVADLIVNRIADIIAPASGGGGTTPTT